MMSSPQSTDPTKHAKFHIPALMLGIILMLLGSFVPTVFADGQGKPDHTIATLVFWSMSAGFIRGLGFIPKHWFFRWIFGGWAALLTFVAAAVLWTMSRL